MHKDDLRRLYDGSIFSEEEEEGEGDGEGQCSSIEIHTQCQLQLHGWDLDSLYLVVLQCNETNRSEDLVVAHAG